MGVVARHKSTGDMRPVAGHCDHRDWILSSTPTTTNSRLTRARNEANETTTQLGTRDKHHRDRSYLQLPAGDYNCDHYNYGGEEEEEEEDHELAIGGQVRPLLLSPPPPPLADSRTDQQDQLDNRKQWASCKHLEAATTRRQLGAPVASCRELEADKSASNYNLLGGRQQSFGWWWWWDDHDHDHELDKWGRDDPIKLRHQMGLDSRVVVAGQQQLDNSEPKRHKRSWLSLFADPTSSQPQRRRDTKEKRGPHWPPPLASVFVGQQQDRLPSSKSSPMLALGNPSHQDDEALGDRRATGGGAKLGSRRRRRRRRQVSAPLKRLTSERPNPNQMGPNSADKLTTVGQQRRAAAQVISSSSSSATSSSSSSSSSEGEEAEVRLATSESGGRVLAAEPQPLQPTRLGGAPKRASNPSIVLAAGYSLASCTLSAPGGERPGQLAAAASATSQRQLDCDATECPPSGQASSGQPLFQGYDDDDDDEADDEGRSQVAAAAAKTGPLSSSSSWQRQAERGNFDDADRLKSIEQIVGQQQQQRRRPLPSMLSSDCCIVAGDGRQVAERQANKVHPVGQQQQPSSSAAVACCSGDLLLVDANGPTMAAHSRSGNTVGIDINIDNRQRRRRPLLAPPLQPAASCSYSVAKVSRQQTASSSLERYNSRSNNNNNNNEELYCSRNRPGDTTSARNGKQEVDCTQIAETTTAAYDNKQQQEAKGGRELSQLQIGSLMRAGNDPCLSSAQSSGRTATTSSNSRASAARLSRPGRSPVSLQRQTHVRLARHRLKIQQQRQEQLASLARRERQHQLCNSQRVRAPNLWPHNDISSSIATISSSSPRSEQPQQQHQVEIDIVEIGYDNHQEARGQQQQQHQEQSSSSSFCRRVILSKLPFLGRLLGSASLVHRRRRQGQFQVIPTDQEAQAPTEQHHHYSLAEFSQTRPRRQQQQEQTTSTAAVAQPPSSPAATGGSSLVGHYFNRNNYVQRGNVVAYHMNRRRQRRVGMSNHQASGKQRGANHNDHDHDDGSIYSGGSATSVSSTTSASSSTLSLNDRPFCKICHLSHTKMGDRLISPCKCSGTMRYIHCSCLLKWLEISNRTAAAASSGAGHHQNADKQAIMSCELCSHEYTWHRKFNYRNIKLPKCSLKDLFLHLIFLLAIGSMLFCALAPIFARHKFVSSPSTSPSPSTASASASSQDQPTASRGPADKPISLGHEAPPPSGRDTSYLASSSAYRRSFASTSAAHLLNGSGTQNGGRLASDEKFILTCAAFFFVSFFVSIYAQTKSRDTLYGLVVKFINSNQTYYITEYDHGAATGAGDPTITPTSSDNHAHQQAIDQQSLLSGSQQVRQGGTSQSLIGSPMNHESSYPNHQGGNYVNNKPQQHSTRSHYQANHYNGYNQSQLQQHQRLVSHPNGGDMRPSDRKCATPKKS